MASTLLYLDIKFDGRTTVAESSAASYVSQIEVEKFSWSVEADHALDITKVRDSITTVLPERLKIEKFFDRSSTVLAKYMAEQKMFESATLKFSDAVISDRAAKQVMTIEIFKGYVEDIKLNASGSGRSMAVNETVLLSFKRLRLEYFPRTSGAASARGGAGSFVFETKQPGS